MNIIDFNSKKVFQSNRPLVKSVGFITNEFKHVGGRLEEEWVGPVQ